MLRGGGVDAGGAGYSDEGYQCSNKLQQFQSIKCIRIYARFHTAGGGGKGDIPPSSNPPPEF